MKIAILIACVSVLGFIAWSPAAALAVLRWLFKSEVGRAVLIASTVLGLVFWFAGNRYSAGYRAAMAECARANDRAAADAAKAAVKRDDNSAAATDKARDTAADRRAKSNERAQRVEAIAHEPRPPVPAVCPDPDPRIVRELQAGSAELRAAEGRLRDL